MAIVALVLNIGACVINVFLCLAADKRGQRITNASFAVIYGGFATFISLVLLGVIR